MKAEQTTLSNNIQVMVPKRWRIRDNVLIVVGHSIQYYLLRFLAMSQMFDTIRVEWCDKYEEQAEIIMNNFSHSGWVIMKTKKEERALPDKTVEGVEKRPTYSITVNVAILEKVG
ncbi:hypothetical protein GOV10_00945 [Candidatus Woesearchaeota archaeon]|nr:hypothetical protein [Candidatus Woesearchaeota archaeon]